MRGTVLIALKLPAGTGVYPPMSFSVLSDGSSAEVVNISAYSSSGSIVVHPPVGTHRLTVTEYDRPDAKGNVLSTGTHELTIPASGEAELYLVMAAVVAQVSLALTHVHPTVGSPAIINLQIVTRDADGDLFAYGTPYAYPLTLTSSDPLNGKPSQSTISHVIDPGPDGYDRVSVAYSGARVSRITFTASGAGLKSVAPAVLVPVAPPPRGEQIIVTGGDDPNSAFGASSDYQFLATFGVPPQSSKNPYGFSAYGAAAVDAVNRLVYVADYQTPNGPHFDIFQLGGAYALADSFQPHIVPVGVALDAAAKKLYVTDASSADISIFGTTGGHALLGKIHSGVYASSLAVDPVRQRLYAAGCGSDCNGLGLVRCLGISMFSTIPPYTKLGSVTNACYGPLAIDAAAGKLYVEQSTPIGSSYLDVFTTSNLGKIAQVGLGILPCGIAVDVQGRRLYVAEPFSGPVPYTGTVLSFGLDVGLEFLDAFPATAYGNNVVIAPYRP